MSKTSSMQASLIGGILATAATAGYFLLRDEKRRKKVMNSINKAVTELNTPGVKEKIRGVVNKIKQNPELSELDETVGNGRRSAKAAGA